MVKNLPTKNAGSLIEKLRLFTLIKGIIIAYLITIPFFMLFALILSYTDFPEKYISTLVLVTTVISILLSSMSVSKNISVKGWLVGGMVGFLYILILYILNGIVYKNFSVSRGLITTTFICIATGLLGGITGINVKGSKKVVKKKRGRY